MVAIVEKDYTLLLGYSNYSTLYKEYYPIRFTHQKNVTHLGIAFVI